MREIKKCDGQTMRDIFLKLNENYLKPIMATTPFSIVDDDGSSTDYELNNTTAVSRLITAIHEVLGREYEREMSLAYLNRIIVLLRFGNEHREELKSKDFMRDEDDTTLYSYSMFNAVADAKLDKKGRLTRNSFFKAHRKVS